MIENTARSIARGEPSHIHIPRPSRSMRRDAQPAGARRVAGLEEHIDAYRELSTSHTLDDPRAIGNCS